MQIENDYDKDVYNGDVGTVKSIDMEEQELTAGFDGRTIVYGFGELDMLVPPMRRRSTRARAPNTPPWSSRC